MTVPLALTLTALGLVGGFFSGWLGIGGGIIMAPLLLYLPPWLGVGDLGMKAVAGLTVVQSLFATGSGVIVHRRFKHVNRALVLWAGLSTAAAALAGALLSSRVSADLLMGVFAAMALVASALMFLPKREPESEPPAAAVRFNRGLAAGVFLFLGFIGGLVGQTGAFIIIPVMLYVLRIPTRTTIGSSLGVVFLAGIAGSLGKALTGQVEYLPALFLVAGALAGAQAGGYISQSTRRTTLRRVLALLIAAAALRMVWDLAGG